MGIFDKLIGKKKTAQKHNAPENPLLYSGKELDEYESFIEANFGGISSVLHEIVSPDIHLDILLTDPTEEHNFHKLITMGMGAYDMNVPEELDEYELKNAELIIYLPADRDIRSSDEKYYRPINHMKMLGRLPLYEETWLGYGHTVHCKEDTGPFAENTDFNGLMLLNGIRPDFEPLELRLKRQEDKLLSALSPLSGGAGI